MPIHAPMEMKAMLFAGGGLFLSMVATTMWMSNDVARMQEQERAKDAARCRAALSATADTAPAAGSGSGFDAPAGGAGSFDAPAGDGFGSTATDTAPEGCADQPAGATDPNATGATTDPNAAAIDPSTGLPVEADASSAQVDPNTGLPTDPASQPVDTGTQSLDAASQPIDPAAAPSIGMDPGTGAVPSDPAMTAPTGGATGGF